MDPPVQVQVTEVFEDPVTVAVKAADLLVSSVEGPWMVTATLGGAGEGPGPGQARRTGRTARRTN
jgi:hypothetical protein